MQINLCDDSHASFLWAFFCKGCVVIWDVCYRSWNDWKQRVQNEQEKLFLGEVINMSGTLLCNSWHTLAVRQRSPTSKKPEKVLSTVHYCLRSRRCGSKCTSIYDKVRRKARKTSNGLVDDPDMCSYPAPPVHQLWEQTLSAAGGANAYNKRVIFVGFNPVYFGERCFWTK